MLASLTIGSWVWIATIAGPAPQGKVVAFDDAGLRRAGLTRFWEANLPVAARDRLEKVFVVEGTLYATTDRGTVFAIDANAGLIRWGSKLTEGGYKNLPMSTVWAA
jgi:outer membrane protein assembly factor BamB